jgi:putative phage-type endonuclease
VSPLTRTEWLLERKSYLGGTDVAAICGFTPKWRTPYKVYVEKTSDSVEETTSDAMEMGILLEPVIVQRYHQKTGRTVMYGDQDVNYVIDHPEHSFLKANIDAWVQHDGVTFPLEAKSARAEQAFKWGEPGTSDIPMEYYTQVAWYCHITNAPYVDIAVLINTSDFRMYRYHKDPEFEENLAQLAINFWNNHIIPRVPPEAIAHSDLSHRYPGRKDSWIESTLDILYECQNYKNLKAQATDLAGTVEQSALRIKSFMQDNEVLTNANGEVLATWKINKKNQRTFLFRTGVDYV